VGLTEEPPHSAAEKLKKDLCAPGKKPAKANQGGQFMNEKTVSIKSIDFHAIERTRLFPTS
jgi:hypothetical protein